MPDDDPPPPLPTPYVAPPPLPTPNAWFIWLVGIVIADSFTGLLCWLVTRLESTLASGQSIEIVVFPSLFLLPFLNGFVAAFCWRSLRPTVGEIAAQSLCLTFFDLLGATVVLHEGVICLLMASPLLYGFILTGAAIGRAVFRQDSSRLRICILPLLAITLLAEPRTRSDHTSVVSDEILIHAPPARVWPQITSFPAIPEPPHFWLFKIGLPYPVATTSAGDFPGADRRCIFSGDAVFKETVAQIVPEKELTFDIVESPPDPELLGHLTARRGQFLLRDNGDGTTTLIGKTWYTLHVRPLWYFDWWTHLVFRAVHLRVMEDVKRRAEQPGESS